MKNLVASILLFLFIPFAVFAQPETEKQKEWQMFSPQLEEFSVEVPEELQKYGFNTNNENRRYTGLFDGIYYFIFSDSQKEDYQYKTVLKFIESNQKSELENQKKSDFMKCSFFDDEDFYHTIYTAKTEKRIYVFHLVSPENNNPNVKRFFDNLKINEQTLTENNEKEDTGFEKSGNLAHLFETNDFVPGTGRSGDRDYNNSKTTENTKTQKPIEQIIQNSLLQITYKPKPKYTDFARFYEITGDVRMRVTFLKDGEIGSTSPVTKLPFGLTKAAISAAKQIRFEPQIYNGKGVHITKVVVYTFTIF